MKNIWIVLSAVALGASLFSGCENEDDSDGSGLSCSIPGPASDNEIKYCNNLYSVEDVDTYQNPTLNIYQISASSFVQGVGDIQVYAFLPSPGGVMPTTDATYTTLRQASGLLGDKAFVGGHYINDSGVLDIYSGLQGQTIYYSVVNGKAHIRLTNITLERNSSTEDTKIVSANFIDN